MASSEMEGGKTKTMQRRNQIDLVELCVCNRVHLILIGFDKIYDDKVRKTMKLSHHIHSSKEKVSYEPLSPGQHSCLVGLTNG